MGRSREARDQLVGRERRSVRFRVVGGRAGLRIGLRHPRDSLSCELSPARIDAIEEDAAGEELERRVELEGIGLCVLRSGDEHRRLVEELVVGQVG
jgi:hypothetical protein